MASICSSALSTCLLTTIKFKSKVDFLSTFIKKTYLGYLGGGKSGLL
jgi:hypothetical protein